MERTRPAYPVSLTPAAAGWTWQVTPPDGEPVLGRQADLESARRTAAFAAAALASLDRARRRGV